MLLSPLTFALHKKEERRKTIVFLFFFITIKQWIFLNFIQPENWFKIFAVSPFPSLIFHYLKTNNRKKEESKYYHCSQKNTSLFHFLNSRRRINFFFMVIVHFNIGFSFLKYSIGVLITTCYHNSCFNG